MPSVPQTPSLSLRRQALELPPNLDHPAVKKLAESRTPSSSSDVHGQACSRIGDEP